ncbi:iron-sulfur protein [Streptomyces venezuelae]|uniref:Cytochrome bc1 complex Rieske iron-sulfur subunit n=1 Tax=Streptomyces venezuelae TaxID=54571 RepID=A0A5P2D289_STRVZ|nr:Rieske (2Fe-2S) protein [Streptomyces venezuelae]QES48863.1 iron-sulfur protein [Streptomyces venezuelae]
MGDTTRRRTVLAAGAAALAGTALAGCGQGDEDSAEGATTGGVGEAQAAGPARELAAVSEIPVGGGKVFKDQKVVVTQPKAGEFKAYSAVCTHQGCAVTSVTDGKIVCPCHQSFFKVEDGSVASGPATRPLPAAKITVAGDKINLG